MKSSICLLFFVLTTAPQLYAATPTVEVDVCVYAATPSGILAAVAVSREGHSVVIVEPSRWVGGMLGAGLKPLQDCPNYAATGGMTHQLLPTLGRSAGSSSEKESRVFGPDSIRDDFQKLLDEHGIRVIFDHRIARCEMHDATITIAAYDLAPFDELGCPTSEAKTRNAMQVAAKVFIDASYEGDLMARAAVSYRVGREAESEFDEPRTRGQMETLMETLGFDKIEA